MHSCRTIRCMSDARTLFVAMALLILGSAAALLGNPIWSALVVLAAIGTALVYNSAILLWPDRFVRATGHATHVKAQACAVHRDEHSGTVFVPQAVAIVDGRRVPLALGMWPRDLEFRTEDALHAYVRALEEPVAVVDVGHWGERQWRIPHMSAKARHHARVSVACGVFCIAMALFWAAYHMRLPL
jgi:hypothetical protein